MATKPNKRPLNLDMYSAGAEEVNKGLPKPVDAEVDIALIDTEAQVRTDFPMEGLRQLAESMKELGVLEPVILLKNDNGRYRMISGERRLRAALLVPLTKLPAVIKHELSPLQIRQIQIAENNDRENLSAYDEAMGVADDVENFGFAEAVKIWNRSDSWISKRSSVKKYAGPVIDLFKQGMTADLEVIGALNQLCLLDGQEFDAMAERFASDTPPTRDDVRNKVTSIREWKERAEKAKKDSAADKKTVVTELPLSKKERVNPAKKTAPVQSHPIASNTPVKLSSDEPDSEADNGSAVSADDAATATATALSTERLHLLREELYQWGVFNGRQFQEIQTKLEVVGEDMNASDWVLWSGFLSLMLPAIGALGDKRGEAFMKRLQSEIKKKSSIEMWSDLHPVIEGADTANPDAPRNSVPAQPPKWRF